MKVLTDTHTLVWALTDPHLLGVEARRVLMDEEVLASVANLWELCLKARKKDALLADPRARWSKYIVRRTLGSLPDLHKDPFNRILVAQSMAEKIPLVSKDAHLSRYGIAVIW